MPDQIIRLPRRKIKTKKDVLMLAGLSVITVFTWIGLEIHWALKKDIVIKTLNKELRPLDSKLDLDFVKGLESRVNISQEDLSSVVAVHERQEQQATSSSVVEDEEGFEEEVEEDEASPSAESAG